ncbi:MAG: iron ABC transporter permease [candidate division WOR-3 bacterium]|nr:iron ABC transporter permease [candidate division WOR-3 bacterium]MCX7756705.1 iron ABC transporter permease [candidate division WOR-3 bacterium]MDW7988216.1 iron ABC transporter permease [candidate division WOR-3 bacterium]
MRKNFSGFILVFLILIAACISFFLGPAGFSWKELSLPIKLRLPRIILGLYAGGVLSIVGATLQGLLQNPLVDPYILGIASGASLGAAISQLWGKVGIFTLPLFEFLGATFAIFGVYFLAQIKGTITKLSLVLAGVILSFFLSSLVMLFMIFSQRSFPEIIYFLMGRLNLVFTKELLIAFIVFILASIPLLIYLFSLWRALNIVSMHEDVAKSLGIDIKKLTTNIFLVSSFLVAGVVSFTGTVSFIGLCVPHIVRLIYGPDHYKLLPSSFLLGASILIITDLIARSIAPVELPLSVITALFGVPFFIYLLKKKL